MPAPFHSCLLAGASLLVVLAGCQRAGYSFQPVLPAATAAAPPSDTVRLAAVVTKRFVTQARARRAAPRYRQARRQAVVAQCQVRLVKPVIQPVTFASAPASMRANPQRPAGLLRRTAAAVTDVLNENTLFNLLFLGGGLLLVIGGFVLALAVGGWLGVLGGVAAIGGGLCLLFIWFVGQGQRGR
jgi:hypothetical protein